jgi:hypothetical protein
MEPGGHAGGKRTGIIMNAIRPLLERKGVLPAAALVLGLVLGLVYAWGIQPVRWKDASPELLRSDLQIDYLKMAIDSYTVNRDVDLAIARFEAMGDAGPKALRAIETSPGEVSPTAIQGFRSVVVIFEPGAAATPEATATARPPSAFSVTRLILPACGLTLVLAIVLAGVLFLRSRGGRAARPRPSGDTEGQAVEGEVAVPSVEGGAPLATFRTTYSLGDDIYDDSFSIESAAGDFLGECGVGIGDTIGVGDPKKVSAFEVWLFDKNDIQTVTKVLMSQYTHQDEPTRQRMAAKGDPVLAENGTVVTLETASLRVEARVVDMSYGEGVLPPESYFARMTVELRALPKGLRD